MSTSKKHEYISCIIMQCDRTRSLDQFFATVAQADPPVLGLLGCGCSVASEPVAEIIHHWNISQVSKNSIDYIDVTVICDDYIQLLNVHKPTLA